ncbi:MAG TPA: Hsp20/alpha crystallin family protein [Bryobacteraceae bacterium]
MNPFALMREFTKEMDRTFSPFWGEELAPRAWAPAIEVNKSNGNLLIAADLPGIKTEDVKVEVTDDVLTIQGERKYEKKEEKEGAYRSERSYGQFYRTIPLPEGAKTDQIKAEMKNGVLEVKIPVTESTEKVRQVPVAAGLETKDQKRTTAA